MWPAYTHCSITAYLTAAPTTLSYWKGKLDALTDIYQLHYTGAMLFDSYYGGTLTASTDGPIYGFTTENFWELIRSAYMLLENIDGVPGMEQSEKDRLSAECKCLIASTYFNMFKCYGGLPIVTGTFSGLDGSYNLPRASVDRTVRFMTGLLDEASSVLPWAYTGTAAQTETGRWTRAAAMALKCKICGLSALQQRPALLWRLYRSRARQPSLVWQLSPGPVGFVPHGLPPVLQ